MRGPRKFDHSEVLMANRYNDIGRVDKGCQPSFFIASIFSQISILHTARFSHTSILKC